MFFGDPVYPNQNELMKRNEDADNLAKNFEIVNQAYSQSLERPVNDYIDQRIEILRYKIGKLSKELEELEKLSCNTE